MNDCQNVCKLCFSLILMMLACTSLKGQVHKSYDSVESGKWIDSLKSSYGNLKELPKGFEIQALLALSHYPELKDLRIKFRTKKGGAPFVSRPTVWSTFFKRRKKRTYLILIRTQDHPVFSPILLENMAFNAQVGVFGHELAHTLDFSNRGLFNPNYS